MGSIWILGVRESHENGGKPPKLTLLQRNVAACDGSLRDGRDSSVQQRRKDACTRRIISRASSAFLFLRSQRLCCRNRRLCNRRSRRHLRTRGLGGRKAANQREKIDKQTHILSLLDRVHIGMVKRYVHPERLRRHGTLVRQPCLSLLETRLVLKISPRRPFPDNAGHRWRNAPHCPRALQGMGSL
jgi:hypothetical protein